MLILGRRINQTIVFPNCGITVHVLDVNGRVAKIGIDAPKKVEIMRGELAVASQSNEEYRSPVYRSSSEQEDAPESPSVVLQFAQRLAEIKAGLHLFQQRRAAGDETGADQVFGDLLNEIARLDADSLISHPASPAGYSAKGAEFVSEERAPFQTYKSASLVQVLVINEPNCQQTLNLPAGTFHGCQICSVNNREIAIQAIKTSEPFDYIVCNDSSMSFDELELVRTIRSDRRLDKTKVFVTTRSVNALENLELSSSYRIDGWLARPLLPHDLWQHIVESQQFEFQDA